MQANHDSYGSHFAEEEIKNAETALLEAGEQRKEIVRERDENEDGRRNGDTVDDARDVATGGASEVFYTIDDTPPWQTCLLIGFQHYLTMVGSTLPLPMLISNLLCLGGTDPTRAALISNTYFVSGFITLAQTTFGVRLPIIQGGSSTYLASLVIILTTHFEPCPDITILQANETGLQTSKDFDYEANWKVRMREISGSIAVASLLQIFLGISGLAGILLKWISPLTITPTITLVGLSLIPFAINMSSENWGIAILTAILMTLFSRYLENVPIPVKWGKGPPKKIFIFKLFPVLIAVVISWSVCGIATHFDLFKKYNKARTDINKELLANTPWISVPNPGGWGPPTVSISSVIGIMVAVLSSIIESIGDYHACAKFAGAPPPSASAINRGIFIEGVGSTLTALLGVANGSTSYSENVAAISITKVGSRRVVQVSAMFMIVFGLLGKIGALFVNIPEPIVGGMFFSMFSIITGAGISSLQFVNMSISRNIFILGTSIFVGLAIPRYLAENRELVQTGSPIGDQAISILFGTSMFVGGITGFFLDNTIPGTPKDRGLLEWHRARELETGKVIRSNCYDLPFGMDFIRRVKWLERFPLSPTFIGFGRRKVSSVPLCQRRC